MKVAILVSGCIRNEGSSGKYYNDKIFKNFDTDIFVHTWNINGKRRGQKVNINENKISQKNINEMLDCYKPVKYLIEDMKEITKTKMKNIIITTKKRPYINFWCQIYGLYQVNKLKIEYEKENNIKYDVVIRLRFDKSVEFGDKIGEITKEKLENCINKKLWYNNLRCHDRFFVLPNKIADEFFEKLWTIITTKKLLTKYRSKKGAVSVDILIIGTIFEFNKKFK